MKKYYLFIFFIIFSWIVSSCQSNDNIQIEDETSLSEDLVRSIGFIPLSQRLTSNEDFTRAQQTNSFQGDEFKESIGVIICSWDWGRPKHECHGFGFCNFEWFPDFYSKKIEDLPDIDLNSSIIETDSLGRLYTDLLLASPVSKDDAKNLPLLEIETPLEFQDTIDSIPITITAEKGSVPYDSDIKPYGGYRVRLTRK